MSVSLCCKSHVCSCSTTGSSSLAPWVTGCSKSSYRKLWTRSSLSNDGVFWWMSSSVCFSACSSGRLLVLDMASSARLWCHDHLFIVKSAFESRIVIVVRNIPGFSCSHPNISKFALGALSVCSVATLVFSFLSFLVWFSTYSSGRLLVLDMAYFSTSMVSRSLALAEHDKEAWLFADNLSTSVFHAIVDLFEHLIAWWHCQFTSIWSVEHKASTFSSLFNLLVSLLPLSRFATQLV